MTESMLLLFTISQNHIQKFCRNVHMSFYPWENQIKHIVSDLKFLESKKKKKKKKKKGKETNLPPPF